MTHFCLGGNQAFGWNDPDPAFAFDDFAVYNMALTSEEIAAIISAKTNTTRVQNVKAAKAENGARYHLAGQKVGSGFKGIAIENGKKTVMR